MKKWAVITGGTRGIGLGIAKALADSGINLILNGTRAKADVQDVLDSFQSVDVQYVQASLPTDNATLLSEVEAICGCPNFFISNAGIAPKVRADLLETSPESFDSLIDVNLKSAFFLMQNFAKLMISAKKTNENFVAKIVVISSISAVYASVNRGEYCISKAGLSMAAKLFAVRLAEENIGVYEVRPGVIETDMTAGVKDKYDGLIGGGLTLQNRWGKPQDIGAAVHAIVNGGFEYATGQIFTIDGGLGIERL